ncbi:hypothetical protein R6Q57_028138 [Mikania cordata]
MNPRLNNLNQEFNPFSYDHESLRNFYAQLQQNPNFQHFQPNFQQPPNFQPGFAAFSQPWFESDYVSPSQPENEVVPETQDTLRRKKGKKNKQSVGAGLSSGPMAPKQWTPMKKPLSEDIKGDHEIAEHSSPVTQKYTNKKRRKHRADSQSLGNMDGSDSGDTKQSTADMTQFVQTLLQQMQSRFQTMSDSIVQKIDEMGDRINELEQSINDLRTEMGVEGSPSPLSTSKKPDEPKTEEGSA